MNLLHSSLRKFIIKCPTKNRFDPITGTGYQQFGIKLKMPYLF